MSKIGRNDPCPCGSGKKYKKCCLLKQRDFSEEYIWKLAQEADEKFFTEIIRFAIIKFGPEIFDFAWQDFTEFREDEFIEEENPHNQLFFPWLLYSWLPVDFYPQMHDLKNNTIAELFLKKNILNLSDFERDFIRSIKTNPFSFYEVMEIEYDQSIVLKDFFTGKVEKVIEHKVTHHAKITDIIYCRVIQIHNVNLILGCSTIAIPAREKIRLLDLKTDILGHRKKITKSLLLEWSDDIRLEYMNVFEALTSPPIFVNKTGDPLSFNDIKFEISNPSKIWELLKHLDNPFTEEEFLEEAEFDSNGKLHKIEFNWLSPKKRNELTPSIYAHIQIEENELVISVNSNKRANYAKKKIKSLLGKNAKYKMTVTKSFEAAMKEQSDGPGVHHDPKMQEIEESLEFQNFMDQYLENHWENWINDKVPALGNITPKEAMKKESTKRKLILLLEEFERNDEHVDPIIKQLKYINLVRRELGL